MTWDTSDITNDTIYQEGTFGFLFTASGNIERGQCVRFISDNKVTPSIVGCDGIGVCDHKVYHKDECCIYLCGNIVTVSSPESISAGSLLYASSNGFVSESRYASERPIAMSIEPFTLSVTNNTGKVLLI
jgi:hypothetical protein